jgi:hypothetical protein
MGEARASTPPSAMRALAHHSGGGGCYWPRPQVRKELRVRGRLPATYQTTATQHPSLPLQATACGRGVPHIVLFWFGLRGYSRSLILSPGRLISFNLLAYLFRLSARGIAMPLRCRHKPATAGIRSSAMARAQQASGRRPTPLPDGLHTFFFRYSLLTVSFRYFLYAFPLLT